MIHAIMGQMSEKGGSSDVRASSSKTMRGDYNNANETPYTPLELFVMELFRTMSSNTDSFAMLSDTHEPTYGPSPFQPLGLPFERHSYIPTPHSTASRDKIQFSRLNLPNPGRVLVGPSRVINDITSGRRI